jgi:molybdate transport system regulatory protein
MAAKPSSEPTGAKRKAPALVPAWNLLVPGGERIGEDRIRLLHCIARTGSLREAAKLCDLSYRTAWTRVRELNALFPEPLVLSAQGGSEGGSTRLSDDAKHLVGLHIKASDLFRRAADAGGLGATDLHALDDFRKRLAMRSSVRNQFAGTVRSVRRGKVLAEIELDLRGGSRIVSQITLASCDALGLAPGQSAWALVKSTWIDIACGVERPRLSARNILAGRITSVRKGAVNDEVGLTLDGGDKIAATVASNTVSELGLRPGVHAWAVFKASSVIVAVL